MMKRKLLIFPLVLVLLIGLLAGCSAPSAGNDHAFSKGNAADGLVGNPGENLTESDVVANRKLIRKIHLSAETEDMDTLLSQVNERVNALDGYIEARDIYNGSTYSGSVRRTATLTIRIPADRLDSFVSQVADISNIISNTENSDDITLKYAATESRLKVLRAEEERLLTFLSEAKTVAEMVQIETRLTEVLAEIETITSQLKLYDNLVDYGTITLSVNEVEQYTEIQTEKPSMWEQISTGFVKSLQNVGGFLKALFVFFIIALPYLVLIGAVAGIVLLIIKLRKKKKKA